ncbi:hypothetical protein C6A88_33750 [Mycolicibacterium austroafricanum]|nr:hypothetical protein C6A88_33750 [Mycolicibacterium austroafricanum]
MVAKFCRPTFDVGARIGDDPVAAYNAFGVGAGAKAGGAAGVAAGVKSAPAAAGRVSPAAPVAAVARRPAVSAAVISAVCLVGFFMNIDGR